MRRFSSSARVIALAGWSALALVAAARERTRAVSFSRRSVSSSMRFVIQRIASTGICRSKPRSTRPRSAPASPITQLVAALAWAVLLAPEAAGDRDPRRSWRTAARVRSRHHLHRLHGGSGHLVRRSAARRNLVCRARSLCRGCCSRSPAFVLGSIAPDSRFIAGERAQRPRRIACASAPACWSGWPIYDIYLIAPPFGVQRPAGALLALIGIGLLLQRRA